MPQKTATEPELARRRPLVHAALLLVPVLFALSTVPGVRPHGGYSFVLDGLLNNLAYCSAAALCLVRTRTLPPAERRAGHLLAGGLAAYGMGNVAWTFAVRPLLNAPDPSGADVLYLLFYPLVFAALVVTAARRHDRHDRSLWLDGLVAGLAVGAIAAAAVVEPLVSQGGTWTVVVISVAYPALDLVVLLVLAAVLSLYGWRPPRGLWLLAAGLVVFVAADIWYLLEAVADTYEPGGLTDGIWVTGVVLMALAPGGPGERSGPRLPGWALMSVPVLATVAALSVLLADHAHRVHPVALVLAAASVLGALVRLLVTFTEVTALAENRVLALTDDLTGLGNRRALHRRAEQLLSRSAHGAVALLLLDLDEFKEVNDSLGHQAGDRLLCEVARRLEGVCAPARAVVFRLGGDEFAITVDGVGAERVDALARDVHVALYQPHHLLGVPVRARVSIGIAVLPASGAQLPTLLRQADVAMYHAKSRRLGTFAYREEVDEFVSGDRLEIAELLRTDIAGRRLVLHYQPKVDVVTGQVHGVEALVRWEHPRRGLLYPDAFLPVVESAGLMDELTRAVLVAALDQALVWWQAGTPLAVAVNLSATSLRDEALPDRVSTMLTHRGLPAELLEIEITEGFLMADRERARGILDGLRSRGVRVAVDDYGTGYSSLAYLRQLPVDDLKLDKSFLADLFDDPRALAIVRSTIGLAHSLGMRLVAEGVEDEATSRELAAAGCDVIQGWFYAKALPAAELQTWLRAHDPAGVSAALHGSARPRSVPPRGEALEVSGQER